MQTLDRISPTSSDLLNLRGTRPLFDEELRTRIAAGARCVRFEYCFSFLFFTVRRQSPVYLTEAWQQRYLVGLRYSVLALVLGPWGVPWGVVFALWSVWVNTTGGVDCTEAVLCASDTDRATPGASSGADAQPVAQPEEVPAHEPAR
jgi:hypothetical protein